MSAADWWLLAALLIATWAVFPAAAFAAWRWALHTHTLYRAAMADAEIGRPAAAAPAPAIVAALDREHHRHAVTRPPRRGLRSRIRDRRDPFPELASEAPAGGRLHALDACKFCGKLICERCHGCGCLSWLCECTQVATITAIGPNR